MASVLQICTGNEILALTGSLLVHTGILIFLYVCLRNTWLQTYERSSIKEWWGLCLIPVFFYCGFSFLAFFLIPYMKFRTIFQAWCCLS